MTDLVQPVTLSIIAPTFNEVDNVALLADRIAGALGQAGWELIFVDDDSPDGTADKARQMAATDRRIRILHRLGRRGLASAVVDGAMMASAPVIAVIDADLQHDETALPRLRDAILQDGYDIAVGSRYILGGSTGNWSEDRIAKSHRATWLTKKLLGVRLSDPMSGFFAFRRNLLSDLHPRLSQIGFKILLDMIASAPAPLRVAEVPYHFRMRERGESKLDSRTVWDFLMLLADKKLGWMIPARLLSFLIVGGTGVFVHLAVLTLLYQGISIAFLPAQAVATLIAMTSNFLINNELTYHDRKLKGARLFTGWLSFCAICALGAVSNIGLATRLYAEDWQWALSALAGIAVGSLWNFIMSYHLTWGRKKLA